MAQYSSDKDGRALKEGDRVLIVSSAGWSGKVCRLDHWDMDRMRWGLFLDIENSSRGAVRFYAAKSLRKLDKQNEGRITDQLHRQADKYNTLAQQFNVRGRSSGPRTSTTMEGKAARLERIEAKMDHLSGMVADLVGQIANLRIERESIQGMRNNRMEQPIPKTHLNRIERASIPKTLGHCVERVSMQDRRGNRIERASAPDIHPAPGKCYTTRKYT